MLLPRLVDEPLRRYGVFPGKSARLLSLRPMVGREELVYLGAEFAGKIVDSLKAREQL